MRVLIVDDEPLAREALERVLRSRADVHAFDSAKDGYQALDLLEKNPYDVVLLDIRMPELSGIELADRLKSLGYPMPSIVFVTAHDQHAIAAFERHAIDYVLKPFSDERIHNALDVAACRTQTEKVSRLIELLPRLEDLVRKPSRLAIKTKGRVIFVDPAEIVSVEAQGNYVLLQRISGSYLLRESISAVAEKLRPHGFIRIHRSVLVNSAFVEEIHPWMTTGEYVLRMKGGKELTVSRTYKHNLREITSHWVGSNGQHDG
jgi:two-component system LytT family response regulator